MIATTIINSIREKPFWMTWFFMKVVLNSDKRPSTVDQRYSAQATVYLSAIVVGIKARMVLAARPDGDPPGAARLAVAAH